MAIPNIRLRLLLDAPQGSKVISLQPSKATIGEFGKRTKELIQDSCVVGTRLEEQEFSSATLAEFAEDEQPVPPQGYRPILWPDFSATTLNDTIILRNMVVRRIPYGTYLSLSYNLLTEDPTYLVSMNEMPPETPLEVLGIQDKDTLLITLKEEARTQLVTEPAQYTGPNPLHLQVKAECDYASWDGINCILEVYGNDVKQAIRHLKEERKVQRDMARAKREKKKAEEAAKARAEKAGKDGGSSSSASDKALVVAPDTGSGSGSSSGSGSGSGSDKKEGKESKENLVGVSQYATLFRVSSVRSKVLWATPAQIAEQLDSHKGDVDKTVKYLREHQSDYVSDPSEVELIEMFPSHSRDTISRILKSAGSVDNAAMALLDIEPDGDDS